MPIERLRPSFSFDEVQLNELKRIAPEAFADGKINWETLKEALGEHLEEENNEIEHFGLFWPGKREARKIASIPSQGTLIPVFGEGLKADGTPDNDGTNDSHNIFIDGENLEVLKILQKSYAGMIKMVYIDPPYNTGNDFVYDDNFTEPLQEYLKKTGQIDNDGKPLTTNKKADGRFHSKWLSMIYPRLRLARNLLKDDGVIFVSIDDNEVNNLRILMNEVFGEENFLAVFIWKRRASSALADKNVSTDHEYVVCFQKGNFDTFRGLDKDFGAFKNPNNDPKGDYVLGDLTVGMTASMRPNQAYDLTDPSTGIMYPYNPNRVWAFIPSSMENLISSGKIYFPDDPKKRPMLKRYKKDLIDSCNPISSLLSQVGLNTEATKTIQEIFNVKLFEYSKPLSLMNTLIGQILRDNEIVLDFFSGSGTLAHSVQLLNQSDSGKRKYICVQFPEPCDKKSEAYLAGYENISEIGKERMRRVSKKLVSDNKSQGFDSGFAVYKLINSNYKVWNNFEGTSSSQLENLFNEFEIPLNDNWTESGLLSEIILIEGFPLDSHLEYKNDYSKNKVMKVVSELSQHSLLVCLDKKIHEETITNLKIDDNDIFICFGNAITDQDKLRLSDNGLIKTI